MNELKDYRLFCPRCAAKMPTAAFLMLTPRELRYLIDQPCWNCMKLGVDAVEVKP